MRTGFLLFSLRIRWHTHAHAHTKPTLYNFKALICLLHHATTHTEMPSSIQFKDEVIFPHTFVHSFLSETERRRLIKVNSRSLWWLAATGRRACRRGASHTFSIVSAKQTQINVDRDRNVLFNDALNTFYLRLYGIRHMVKDHSDSEKGNPLPPHRLLLSISSKGSFICTIPQTG